MNYQIIIRATVLISFALVLTLCFSCSPRSADVAANSNRETLVAIYLGKEDGNFAPDQPIWGEFILIGLNEPEIAIALLNQMRHSVVGRPSKVIIEGSGNERNISVYTDFIGEPSAGMFYRFHYTGSNPRDGAFIQLEAQIWKG